MVVLACAQDSPLVGPGAECFLASDCQPGLVCVPQRNGGRVCSNDLSQVMGRPPPEAGMGDASGDASADAPGDGPVQETGGQDTGTGDSGAD